MTDKQRALFLHDLAATSLGLLQGVAIGLHLTGNETAAKALDERAADMLVRLTELLPEEE